MNTPSKQNSIKQSLKSAFRKIPVAQWEIDKFKTELHHLLEITKRQITESEEYHKNNLKSFLQNTYCFSQSYYLNTKNKNDLVIHNSKEDNSRVGVIIETKKPNNRAEMLTFDKFNVKSLQQLIYYYLEERVNHNNTDLKHLIITDIYNWFIFDSLTFDDFFYKNNKLIKEFKDFQSDRLSGKNKDFFYKEIASKYINENQDKLKQKCTYFNFNDYHNIEDNKLISLYKILSPEHLLKLPFINDSNSLDKGFYNELLYIIGLEEVGDNKKIIQRLPSNNRKEGSLLENVIYNLQIYDKLSNLDNLLSFGEKEEEQLFNVSLQLVITWINRILFLKLLEAQLINYNQDESYGFLNINKINNFNDLDTLFFQVLAKKITDRQAINQEKFSFIPYLNSSLFEITELENKTLLIGNLNNEKKLPLFNKTILKDDNSNQKIGESNTLDYLFSFLSAYNFSSEGKEEIQQEIEKLIKQIKDNFTTVMTGNDPLQQELRKKEGELYSLQNQQSLFAESAKEKKAREKKEKDLEKQINLLIQAIEDKQNNIIYRHGFEWRFEFPEVLNKNGDFIGFDIIIGNPPYVRIQEILKSNPQLALELKNNFISASGSFDLYVCFIEKATQLINSKGNISYILPHKFFQASFGQKIRGLIASEKMLNQIIDFGSSQIFDSATTYTCLLFLSQNNDNFKFIELQPSVNYEELLQVLNLISNANVDEKEWNFTIGLNGKILAKLQAQPYTLADICSRHSAGLLTEKIIFLTSRTEKVQNVPL